MKRSPWWSLEMQHVPTTGWKLFCALDHLLHWIISMKWHSKFWCCDVWALFSLPLFNEFSIYHHFTWQDVLSSESFTLHWISLCPCWLPLSWGELKCSDHWKCSTCAHEATSSSLCSSVSASLALVEQTPVYLLPFVKRLK